MPRQDIKRQGLERLHLDFESRGTRIHVPVDQFDANRPGVDVTVPSPI